ncbi:KRAB [Mytilus coruscus]|uniref:KRAB n=1 Tax=Mytilus coruscus TaxID=42192 RepID=A0A6J8EB58_MYTCO|nr:KRAB [Mytilus coruscus]
MLRSTRRYSCQQCDASYTQSGKLSRHKKVVHLGEVVSIKCNFCTMEFSSKTSHKKHKQNIHFETKEFECEICYERFSTKYQMAGHKRSKHDMGRYQCKNCQKMFSFPSSFKEHTGKCNNNETKVFTCETCNNQFITKRAMSVHIQSERQGRLYVRESCGKTYKYPSGLAKHRKSHQQ